MRADQPPLERVTVLGELSRLIISIRGVVQGVGYRPFVYQLATRHNLKGWVCNTSGDVRIEVEGEPAILKQFLQELETHPPPRASVENVTASYAPFFGYERFEIRKSIPDEGKYQLVSPDIATCSACLGELFNPADRRFLYPFTNCTNCGPRFTIIEDIPYDRPKTTMRGFKMCPECQQEYDDPLDRRFHAQPNACPRCGPRLQLIDNQGATVAGDDPLEAAGRLLKAGKILAIKGLGGFLIACDATNNGAVQLLRERKRRPTKPFAVMLSTTDEVRKHCQFSSAEETVLKSPQSPIVLLRTRASSNISLAVAPQLHYLGVMLPYTPLHHVLLRETGLPLVMTSGNLSEEPIAKDNDEAVRRLKGIADYLLVHNRDIYARYDDSVVMVIKDKPQMLRRARGYAPFPVNLPFKARQILACGPELKNTFCLTRDEHAFVSQHIGDMENLETLEHFESAIWLYQKLFRIKPEMFACDMHPDYLSTRYARELAESACLPLIPVQHHHAHVAGCLADNGLSEPVIGVALDGTGFGSDGHIWGGEFMVADFKGFQRLGHFQYVPMPGGTAAIEKPYRMALGYLLGLFGEGILDSNVPFLRQVDRFEVELIAKQIERRLNSPLTSSCGRLFDAVSALIGVRSRVDYEAQAAVELEMIADEGETGSYPFSVKEQDGVNIVHFADMFSVIVRDISRGVPPSIISARFHRTVARIVLQMCRLLSQSTGIKRVALSGGVFQNRFLLRLAMQALEEAGLGVLTHRQVPANDGGISLGQAVIANFAGQGGV